MQWSLRIDAGAGRLHVTVQGPPDAPAALFLHGLGSSAMSWDWLGPELTDGRRIVRLDFRGHGRSEPVPGAYGLPQYAADAVAALRATVTGPAALIGHSLGGNVAWWVAQHHAELVVAALLEDPPLYVNDPNAPEAQAIRGVFEGIRADLVADRESGRSDQQVAERLGDMRWGPPGTPPWRELAHDDAVVAMGFAQNRVDLGVIDGAIDGTTLAGVDMVTPVAVPIVVLAADEARGAAFTRAHEELLGASHPGATVIRVTGGGHSMHDERASRAAFAEQLRRFLDEYAPAAAR